MTTLLGFAALSVDLGYVYMVRTQLQASADAAALAGASAYFTDAAIKNDWCQVTSTASQRASYIAYQNVTENVPTILSYGDIMLGRHDFNNPSAPLTYTGKWNGVNVTARRTVGSANGPLNLFFANIFGISQTGLIATARAAVDDRFAGYRLQEDGVMIPFTIYRNTYYTMLATGLDQYANDANTVYKWPDGIREIKLYPWVDDKDIGGDAPGNFGTLNIGVGDQGTTMLEQQILNGVTAEQLRNEFGTTTLLFHGEDGQPITYVATGNPGLSTGLRDAVQARIGDVVGFFIHDSVADGGSNCQYVISDIRFGRVMDIILTGNLHYRSIVIQPCGYTSMAIVVEVGAPSSNGYVGRAVLVQ